MAESSGVPSMSWTTRNVGVTVLLAMEEHRKAAGRRVALLRDARGWSQEDLAHEAGISSRTVSRFETGRHDGRRGTVRAIAKALEVTESDILGPPPEPLGLGDAQPNEQLDRIETKLDRLLAILDGADTESLTAWIEGTINEAFTALGVPQSDAAGTPSEVVAASPAAAARPREKRPA